MAYMGLSMFYVCSSGIGIVSTTRIASIANLCRACQVQKLEYVE